MTGGVQITREALLAMRPGDTLEEPLGQHGARLLVTREAARWTFTARTVAGSLHRELAAFAPRNAWKRLGQMRARYGNTGTRK